MDKFSVKFTLKYIVLILGLVITVFVLIIYAWLNQWILTLDSTIKILGMGVGATTAIYAAMNLHHISDSYINSVDNMKKTSATHLMERWLDLELKKTCINSDSLIHEMDEAENSDEAYKLFLLKDDERYSLLSILNFFELLSISINNEVANEIMLKDFFRGIVVSYYNDMKNIIDIRRTKINNQRLYKDFEILSKRWS